MRTVHIVDDDEPCRASLRSLLSVHPNLIIRCFTSGDAFLADADELDPGVLLLDVRMPGASGLDVLAALGARRADHAAVVMTGQGNIATAVEAMKAGAFDFVEKPCEPAKLLGIVDAAFGVLEQGDDAAREAQAARTKLSRLSPREGHVLKGLMAGQANKTIADELDLSPRTVEIHRAKLLDKLGVRSVAEAMRIAFTAGVFTAN